MGSLAFNAGQGHAYTTFIAHVNNAWQQHQGGQPTAAELEQFLRSCFVWVLDVEQGGSDERAALDRLRALVVSQAHQELNQNPFS